MASRWAAALLAAVVIACAGCGDSGGAPSPEEDAQEVATRWNEAVAEGDGNTACALMTEHSVEKIEEPFRAPPLKYPRFVPGPVTTRWDTPADRASASTHDRRMGGTSRRRLCPAAAPSLSSASSTSPP